DYLASNLYVATLCRVGRQAFGSTETNRHKRCRSDVSFTARYVSVCMVEEIEGFQTQLHGHTLRDLDVLIQRRIHVPEPWPSKDVASRHVARKWWELRKP